MQRFHTLRIATVILSLCAGACGDDDDNTELDASAKDGGHGDAGDKKDASTSNPKPGKDSGTPTSKDAGADAAMGDAGMIPAPVEPAGTDSEADGGAFELLGSWSSDFGDESIDNVMWSGATLVEFDNEKNTAITQNAQDAMFGPGTFNKIVWTDPNNDSFFYCTVDFGLGSVAAAHASKKTADDSDVEGMGCGGFPWSKLTAK